jgi:hypothetical protein
MPQRTTENVEPSPETVGEAYALNYVWNAGLARLKIPYIVNRTIAQELFAIVRAYPKDWRA